MKEPDATGSSHQVESAEDSVTDSILIGISSVEFQVPVGTQMAGFIARTGPVTGVHDVLTARALVFDGRVALLVIDACALHENTCSQLREFGRSLGLEDVVVAATHTHSGPCIAMGRLGVHDELVHGSMVTAGQQALTEALAKVQPCTAQWVEKTGLNIAFDRRRQEPIDVPVQAIRFAALTGEVTAVLVSYACHPVVLDATNTQVSADYPGFVRGAVEENYPGSICVFTTGAAGEINTGHTAQDSITGNFAHHRTFARAAEIGSRLAQAACGPGQSLTLGKTYFASKDVQLPYANQDGTQIDLTWDGRVSALSVGGLVLLFLPGEPFNSWAQPLPADLPKDMGIVLGYCDGVPGYFPSLEAYEEGGYEVDDAHIYYAAPGPFEKSCSDILSIASQGVLRHIYS